MVEPTESERRTNWIGFAMPLISIHAEMTAIANGTADKQNNVLKNAPHTAGQIAADNGSALFTRASGLSRAMAARLQILAERRTNR